MYLQSKASQAKAYQVGQFWNLILKYHFEGSNE